MIHPDTITTSPDTVTTLEALLRPVQARSRPGQTLSRPSRHRHDPFRHNHDPSRHCHDSFRHCHDPSGHCHNLTLPRPVQALPRLESCSTSLPSGNQVDGLPLACHTGSPRASLRPGRRATDGKKGRRKMICSEENC